MPPTPAPTPSFRSLGLSESLVRAAEESGFTAPTPVQAGVVPSLLEGRDVWACAPTGSGKTASFVLPMLQLLAGRPPRARRAISALILAPTRELAAQIGEHIGSFSRHLEAPLVTRVVFGGVSVNPQMMALRGGADILVATPGRLLDLVEKRAASLSGVSMLVLDEADRLLERGFADELDRIVSLLPKERQTSLFSATFAQAVERLAEAVSRSPARVRVAAEAQDAPSIVQRAIRVDRKNRTQLLRQLVAEAADPRVLVFVATTYATGHVARKLSDRGIPAAAMHGKLSQGAREKALSRFRRGEIAVLVATDVAARGLDIPGVTMVVNYDLPRSPADYVHRIGRTARAGASGIAVSFLTAESSAHFRLIERRHRLYLPREHVLGFEPVEPEIALPTADGTGGVKGKRKSKKDKTREAAARKKKKKKKKKEEA